MTLSLALAGRIAAALERKGITQSQLARAIGIGRAAISQWLAGGSPSDENLRKAAILLGVNYEWLATGRGPVSADTIRQRLSADGKKIDLDALDRKLAGKLRAAIGRRNTEVWELTASNLLAGAGYSAGDLILVDLVKPPRAREIVLAQVGQVPVFRLFLPPYLYAAPPPGIDPPQALTVDNFAVVIRGTVFKRFDNSRSFAQAD